MNEVKTPSFIEFQHVNIGAAMNPGKENIQKDEVSIESGGIDIWKKHDEFSFVYKKLTDNFDFAVQVMELGEADLYTKAGIMARTELNDSSQHVFFMVFPSNKPRHKNNGGCEFQSRVENGINTTAIYPDIKEAGDKFNVSFPNVWIRLKREGNSFESYFSSNNKTWNLYSTFTLTMPHELYVGMAITAHTKTNNKTTGRFKLRSLTTQTK